MTLMKCHHIYPPSLIKVSSSTTDGWLVFSNQIFAAL